MENRKDLTKIALAALIFASASPVSGQAEIEFSGVFLAAKCGAHGCPSTPQDNQNGYYQTDRYNSNQPFGTPDSNQNYPAPSNSDFGRQNSSNRDFNSATYDVAAVEEKAPGAITEDQLLNSLNPQGKAIYKGLDPEAKTLALQLASQENYRDKNLAVKEAQRRMNDRLRSSTR